MEEKFYYDVFDIMRLFNVGKSKAYNIIAEIKVVSNILPIAGRVAITDFQVWMNSPLEKQKMSNRL